MAGFEILKVETFEKAIAANVRFTASDGRLRENRYSWPIATTEAEILAILGRFYAEFEAEADWKAVSHQGLVGYKHEVQMPKADNPHSAS